MARRRRRNMRRRKNFGGKMTKAQYEKAYPIVLGMLIGVVLKASM